MKQVKAHYVRYPETPEGLKKWQLRTEALFREAKLKLLE
jgi:hypothetical protein